MPSAEAAEADQQQYDAAPEAEVEQEAVGPEDGEPEPAADAQEDAKSEISASMQSENSKPDSDARRATASSDFFRRQAEKRQAARTKASAAPAPVPEEDGRTQPVTSQDWDPDLNDHHTASGSGRAPSRDRADENFDSSEREYKRQKLESQGGEDTEIADFAFRVLGDEKFLSQQAEARYQEHFA
ncbi:unnamed protein product [Polarella glacialis]|uniref:Uncharacterized protein n=1 Tax=Polarella glacialis TaxID=89957 RepID=A0A813IMM3_POLGL|nr:unnamed protein product [Polarella glacialis]CAE8652549.1 unnamed protein product [Polarella glacialis]